MLTTIVRYRVTLLALTFFFLVIPATSDARPLQSADTTAYCLRGTMADGTQTRKRSAAHNGLRLGTKIRLVGRPAGPGGVLRYVIRDRIGHGTTLDLWTPSCSKAIRWGRHTLKFKRGWDRPR